MRFSLDFTEFREYPEYIVDQWKSRAARAITEAVNRNAPASELELIVKSNLLDKKGIYYKERAAQAKSGLKEPIMLGCLPFPFHSLAAERVRKATEDAVIAIEEKDDIFTAPLWQFVLSNSQITGNKLSPAKRKKVFVMRLPNGIYTVVPH